jgi:hypothetical protein
MSQRADAKRAPLIPQRGTRLVRSSSPAFRIERVPRYGETNQRTLVATFASARCGPGALHENVGRKPRRCPAIFHLKGDLRTIYL